MTIYRTAYDVEAKRLAHREFIMQRWLDRMRNATTFEEFSAAAAADPRRPGVPIAAAIWLDEVTAAGL